MAKDQPYASPQQSISDILKEALLLGPRILFSRFALRAYVTTILFSIAALALAAFSIVVYFFFYNFYIPHPGFVKPINLQFEQGYHPWGTTSLESTAGPTLASLVKYDVEVSLHLPRSPANKAAGNFMVELRLNGAPADGSSKAIGNLTTSTSVVAYENMKTLAISRRATMLKYQSRLVENAKKVLAIGLYIVGWKEEAETIRLDMMEGVEFGRWKTPKSLRLEIQSPEHMQVYWVTVEFRARLGGLRYLMYNHPIVSFLIFTTAFWGMSATFALSVYFFSTLFPRRKKSSESTALVPSSTTEKTIKSEPLDDDPDADLSDTSRTFPTFSRQPFLHYSGSLMARIKKEEEEESNPGMLDPDDDAPPLPPRNLLPSPAADADVEDEDEDEDADFVLDPGGGTGASGAGGRSDSGLGTSMESSAASGPSVRRRNSRKKG